MNEKGGKFPGYLVAVRDGTVYFENARGETASDLLFNLRLLDKQIVMDVLKKNPDSPNEVGQVPVQVPGMKKSQPKGKSKSERAKDEATRLLFGR
jgi:hypothetical protein